MSSSATAKARVRVSAWLFAKGELDLTTFRSAFLGSLDELCREEPLGGDHLELFRALEEWEAVGGDHRLRSIEVVRSVAVRLAANE